MLSQGDSGRISGSMNQQPTMKTNWFPLNTLERPFPAALRNILLSPMTAENSNPRLSAQVCRENTDSPGSNWPRRHRLEAANKSPRRSLLPFRQPSGPAQCLVSAEIDILEPYET